MGWWFGCGGGGAVEESGGQTRPSPTLTMVLGGSGGEQPYVTLHHTPNGVEICSMMLFGVVVVGGSAATPTAPPHATPIPYCVGRCVGLLKASTVA